MQFSYTGYKPLKYIPSLPWAAMKQQERQKAKRNTTENWPPDLSLQRQEEETGRLEGGGDGTGSQKLLSLSKINNHRHTHTHTFMHRAHILPFHISLVVAIVFVLCFTPSYAQDILLALCSGSTPGRTQGTLSSSGDWTWDGCAQVNAYLLCYPLLSHIKNQDVNITTCKWGTWKLVCERPSSVILNTETVCFCTDFLHAIRVHTPPVENRWTHTSKLSVAVTSQPRLAGWALLVSTFHRTRWGSFLDSTRDVILGGWLWHQHCLDSLSREDSPRSHFHCVNQWLPKWCFPQERKRQTSTVPGRGKCHITNI